MITTQLIYIFSGGLLLFSFFSLGKMRLPSLARDFAFSSLCLAGLIAVLAYKHGEHAGYTAAGLVILLKVFLIPYLLQSTASKQGISYRLNATLKPAASFFAGAITLLGTFFITSIVPFLGKDTSLLTPSLLFVSLALVFLGLLFLILRKDLYSQIFGLLIAENGIATFGVIALGGIPIFLEMGVFLIVITSVMILAHLSRYIQEAYKTTDTSELRELTE